MREIVDTLRRFSRYRTGLILLFFIAAGFYLRVHNLGYLGFRGDEDVTALAVKGILEHGYPVFPSGGVYLRSAPFLYLLAITVKLFGLNELTLRIPAVLFSTATIPLAYFFVTRLFGRHVGLAVAALMTISPWEIETGRTARMYAPFAFFYLLTLFFFYRHYVEEKGKYKCLTTILAIITCMIHELGFTLALLFLFPLLFKRSQTKDRVYLILNFLAVSAFAQIWLRTALYNAARPLQIHQEFETPTSLSWATLAGSWDVGTQVVLSTVRGIFRPFDLPCLDLLFSLYQNVFPAFMVLTSIGLGITCFLIIRTLKEGKGNENLVLLSLTVLIYLHQFTIALITLLLLCFLMGEGLVALGRKKVVILALITGIAFSFWLIYGLASEPLNEYVVSGKSSQFRQTVKALIDFPRIFVRPLFDTMPTMMLLAGLGFLWCFHTGSRNPADKKPLFVLCVFTTPLLVQGTLQTKLALRYFFYLDVLFLLLAVLALFKWHKLVDVLLEIAPKGFSRRISVSRHLFVRTTITSFLLLVFVTTDMNPMQSWLLSEQDYGQKAVSKKFFQTFKLPYYPDHKTTGEYVKKNLQVQDVVIVMDWLEQYYYIGRTDYWIRTTGYEGQTYLDKGRRRDFYTKAFLIADLNQLKQVLSESQGRRVWLVTSSLDVRHLEKVSEDIVQFLENLSKYVVYVGKDGESKVYLLE